jgi:hypothetical protein
MKAVLRRRRRDDAGQHPGLIPPQRGRQPEPEVSYVVRSEEREPRSTGWWLRSSGLLLVAALAIAGAVLLEARQPPPPVQGHQAPAAPTVRPAPAESKGPDGGTFRYVDPPPQAPPGGTYLRATIRPDGTVAVREWIDSARVLDHLALVASQPAKPTGLIASDVRMAADLFTVTEGAIVTDRPSIFRFHAPAFRVHLAYVLRGAVVRIPSTRQLALAWPTALQVGYDGRGGPTLVELTGAKVLSMRCGPAPDRRTRPCGDPAPDGWTVRTDDPGTWLRARIVMP